jgi:hypothetical protein
VMLRVLGAAIGVVAATFMSLSASAAVSVLASNNSPTNLGFFAAGTYHLAGSGLADFSGPIGSGFTLTADGVPFTPVTYPQYNYCNPVGCSFDILSQSFGPGGPGINLGAVMGTLTPTPISPSDWFLIGLGTNITLASAGNIYAQVNDTFYSNNQGAYLVAVSAVPEPATWAMMLIGFAGLGIAARRRKLASAV